MILDVFISVLVFLQKGLLSIGPFILLLGVLIFIHELGHFLAARYCGVKVEVFSLGFGPKLFEYRKGETLFAVSLFPLGGYVKMFGDDPSKKIPASEQHRGFLYKKVSQKLMIAFGGPFMNLLFTLFAFFLLGILGTPALEPQLGDVSKDTKAYSFGFRSGDTILSIDGHKVSYWEDVKRFIQDHPNQEMVFEVSKGDQNKQLYKVKSNLEKSKNIFSTRKEEGAVQGLTPFSRSTQVGVVYNSPAYQAGLRTFDQIQYIEREKVRYWRNVGKVFKSFSSPVVLTVKRAEQDLQIKLPEVASLKQIGIEDSSLYVSKVGEGTPADQVGLKQGDRLVSLNNQKLKDWKQVWNFIRTSSGKEFSLKFSRQGKLQTVRITPKAMYVEGQLKENFMIGVVSGETQVLPNKLVKKETVLGSFAYSGIQTWHWLSMMTIGLYRLAQGKLSMRTLGGPIVIGRMAHNSFKTGFISFLFMMALISLNLFFLNLLPIPMLDGGHILFFTLEGIIGRPIDVKKLIVAQQLGFFVLMFFFAFTFLNDIYNWLNAW
ncbi:MAG: RIP metalloprotease RseP [Bdellovibrionales bacterium]